MLANNASYEDSFITCQTTPNYHRSLLDSLVNMQLASRSPFSGQRLTGPLTFGRFIAELSRNFRENISIRRPQPSAGGASEEKQKQGPWCLTLAKPHSWKLGCCIWSLFLETSVRQDQRQVHGCALKPWYLGVAKPHLWKGKVHVWSTAPHSEQNKKFSGRGCKARRLFASYII